uniref:FAD synthase middle domain-containing protein n=1 Tax=Oryzias latipes TaxID=8090 RepID=A0A3B3IL55_ORYLA
EKSSSKNVFVFVDADETDIAPTLTKLQASWGKRVALGSYPDWLSNYSKVRLVLDSESLEEVEKARIQLVEELPKGSVVTLVRDSVSIAPTEVHKLADDGGTQMGKTRSKLCISASSLHFQKWRDSSKTRQKGFFYFFYEHVSLPLLFLSD